MLNKEQKWITLSLTVGLMASKSEALWEGLYEMFSRVSVKAVSNK